MNTLPANLDIEKLVLSQPMVNPLFWERHGALIQTDDFSLEAHRRIWKAFARLVESNRPTDRVSVATALLESKQLESVGGLTYLIEMESGMPELAGTENYIRILIEHATRRRVLVEADAIMQRAQDRTADITETVAQAELAFANVAKRGVGGEEWTTFEDFAASLPYGMDRLMSPLKFPESAGIKTPWASANGYLGGLRSGDLIVLAGRPSSGKSAAALQIASHSAVTLGKSVGIVSIEMPTDALFRRMICQISAVNASDLKYGTMDLDQRHRAKDAADVILKSGCHIDRVHMTTHRAITAASTRLMSRHGMDLLIVDHLHLMDGPEREERNRLQAITKALKQLARKLQIPVLLVAQLNRECEKRNPPRPQLSDLRESGTIEQDADVVAMIYRAEMYDKLDPSLVGTAEFIIAKQREGPVGTINLWWKEHTQRFEDLS